jgi:pimeloyl-ACP methyl ester carboxylesterase
LTFSVAEGGARPLEPPPAYEVTGNVRFWRRREKLFGLRRAGLQNDAEVTSTLPRYELERIAVPTLVMSVADDLFGTFDGARYTAGHVPGARFTGYTSGGHVWVGHQKEIVSEIAAFLK